MGSTSIIASSAGTTAPPPSYTGASRDRLSLPPHGFKFFQSDDPAKSAARASFGRRKAPAESERPQSYWERELPRLPQSNPLVGSPAEVSKAEQQRDELLAIFRERFETEKINITSQLEAGAKKNWQASEKALQENLRGVSGFFTYISGTSEAYEKTVEADYSIYLGRRNEHRQQKAMLEKFDELSTQYQTQRQEARKAAEEFRTLSASGDTAGAQEAYERARVLLAKSDDTWTQAFSAIGKPDSFDYRKHLAALRGANTQFEKGVNNLNRIETGMRITQKVVIIGGAALATTLSGGAGTPLLIAALQGTGVAFAASALSNTAELGMGHVGYGQQITWDKVAAKANDTLMTTAEAGLNCLGAAAALKYAYYMSRGAQSLHWCARARTGLQTAATEAGRQASTWGARALTLSRQLFLIGGPSGVIASAPSTIYHNTQAVMRGDFHRLNSNSQEIEFQTGMFLQSLGIQLGMSYSCGMFGNAFGQMRTASQNSGAISRMVTYGGSNLVEGYGSYITTKWSMDLEDIVRGKGHELTAEEREQRILSAIVGHFAGMGSEKMSNLHNRQIADAAVSTAQDGRRLADIVGGETLLKDAGSDVEIAAVARRQQDGGESVASMQAVERMSAKIKQIPKDVPEAEIAEINNRNSVRQGEIDEIKKLVGPDGELTPQMKKDIARISKKMEPVPKNLTPEQKSAIKESNAKLQKDISKILNPENTDAQSSRAARMAGTAHVDKDGRIYIRMSNDESRLPVETLAAAEQIAIKKMLAMDRKSGHIVDAQLQARKAQIIDALEASSLKAQERKALIEQLCGVEEKVSYRVYDRKSKTSKIQTKDMRIGGEITEAYMRFSRLPKDGASKQQLENLAKGLIAEADQAFHLYKNGDLYDAQIKPGGRLTEGVRKFVLAGPSYIGTSGLRIWRGMKRIPVVGGVFRLSESVANVAGLTVATRLAVAHLTPTTAGALGPAIGGGMALFSAGRRAGNFLTRKMGLLEVRPRDAARAMALRQQCEELDALLGKDVDPSIRRGLKKAHRMMGTQAREAGQRGPGLAGLVVPPLPFVSRGLNALRNLSLSPMMVPVVRRPFLWANSKLPDQPFTVQHLVQKIPVIRRFVPTYEATTSLWSVTLCPAKLRKLDYDIRSGHHSALLHNGISVTAKEARGFSFSRNATALRSTLVDGFTNPSNGATRSFDQHLRLLNDTMHESVAARMRAELMQEVPIRMTKEYAEAKLLSLGDVKTKTETEIRAHLEALRTKNPADLTEHEIADLRSNMESYIGWVNGSKALNAPKNAEAAAKQSNRAQRRRMAGLVDESSPSGQYTEAGPGIPSRENVRTLAEHLDAHATIRTAKAGGGDAPAEILARVGLRSEDTVSLDQLVKQRLTRELFWVTKGEGDNPSVVGGQLGEFITGKRVFDGAEIDRRLALLYDSVSPKARTELLKEMSMAARSTGAEHPERLASLEALARKCDVLDSVDTRLAREYESLMKNPNLDAKRLNARVVAIFEDVAPTLGATILTPERQAGMIGSFYRQTKGKVNKIAMDIPDEDKKRVKAFSNKPKFVNYKKDPDGPIWRSKFEEWADKHSDVFTAEDKLLLDDIRTGFDWAISQGEKTSTVDRAAGISLDRHAESIRVGHQESLPRAREVLDVLATDVMPRQLKAMALRLSNEGEPPTQLASHELFARYEHGNTSNAVLPSEFASGKIDVTPRMVRGISGKAEDYNTPWNAYPITSPHANSFQRIKRWLSGETRPESNGEPLTGAGRFLPGEFDFFRPFRRRTHKAVTSGPTARPQMG